jgi:ATP-dependent RNA helicase DDX46/PRP5
VLKPVVVKEPPIVKEFKPENVKKEPKDEKKDEKKFSRFSGGLDAFKKARAMSPSAQPKPDPDAPLAPAKVEIPGFPKAMAGVQVFKPEKMDVNVDSVDIAGKFDLANLAKEMMDRRKRVERWRREQKRKVMVEVHEEVKEEKRRQRKAAMEDKSNPWVEDDESAEEAEIDAVKVKKGDEDKMQLDENEDEDPLDAYMSSLKNSLVSKGSVQVEKTENNTENGKVSVVVATRVVATKSKGSARGELVEANQDEPEWSSEDEDESLGDTLQTWTQKQRKLLEQKIDHGLINYESFNKNFYKETTAIAKMTDAELKLYRAVELDGVRIRGKNCPKPVKNWAQTGVSFKVLSVLKGMGFEKPTSIQAQVLPAIMSGRDVIGISKTGSGKTLAFLLPLFRHAMDQRPLEPAEGPIAIIMTPTRELAIQITKDCRKFAKHMRLRTVCVYGGTGISEQIAELKRGAEIIVCTPGRMIDMLAANNGRVTNLRRCTYCVLDEADRMFDMGFEPQVMHVINSIRPDRQLVMFSATFPRSMEALARRILTKPLEVTVGGKSVVCDDVTQNVTVLSEEDKFLKLLELLGKFQEKGSVIAFVHKHEVADALLREVMRAGYPALALHGGMDQYDRDSVLSDYKKGLSNLLIATSVAARGLDVKNLVLVVNFDCPNHYEDYVHRCGRTGRAGNKGWAYTFITEDEAKYAGDIIKALEMSKSDVPQKLTNLWERYKLEQERSGKLLFKNSGFAGTGFKFDDAEKQMDKDRKKMQQAALGLNDSDDDEVSNVDIDKQIEQIFNSKKSVKETMVGANEQGEKGEVGRDNKQKLELAKKMAEKINARKGDGKQSESQATAEAVMKGLAVKPAAAPTVSNKLLADQIAAKLNAKLGHVPMDRNETEQQAQTLEGTYQMQYEEELEINDFPQSCRWKVTSREAIGNITDFSEADIQIRGVYYPPGKEPGEGDERKLFLLITGQTELSVQKAKGEITRIIKEEFTRLQTSYQAPKVGRFKVA